MAKQMLTIDKINNYNILNINNQQPQQETKMLVFHLIGENFFGIGDRIALKRAGVNTEEFSPKNEIDFNNHVIRLRKLNRLPRLWHISCHGDENNIYFNSFQISYLTFAAILNFEEIDILFLDSCSSINFADNLHGIAKNIISTIDEIYNTEGVDICYTFWYQIKHSQSVERAIAITKQTYPLLAKNIFLHNYE